MQERISSLLLLLSVLDIILRDATSHTTSPFFQIKMRVSSAGVGLVIIRTPILLLFSKESHTHPQRERRTSTHAPIHTDVLFIIAISYPKGADFDVNTTDGKGHTVVDLLVKMIRAHKGASR